MHDFENYKSDLSRLQGNPLDGINQSVHEATIVVHIFCSLKVWRVDIKQNKTCEESLIKIL